jgi:hypothetical protein
MVSKVKLHTYEAGKSGKRAGKEREKSGKEEFNPCILPERQLGS